MPPQTEQPQTTARQMPEELTQLSDHEFRVWKHHPVSKVVLQFLRDRADSLQAGVVQAWLKQGHLNDVHSLEVRGRMLEGRDVAGLTLMGVRTFYGLPPAADDV